MNTEPKSDESILETRSLKKTYGAREKKLQVLVDVNLKLAE